jgi:hypothetical protein
MTKKRHLPRRRGTGVGALLAGDGHAAVEQAPARSRPRLLPDRRRGSRLRCRIPRRPGPWLALSGALSVANECPQERVVFLALPRQPDRERLDVDQRDGDETRGHDHRVAAALTWPLVATDTNARR